MKKLLTILFVLSAYFSTAQVYTPMTAAGYQHKREKVDSTLHIPTFCGVPTLRSTTAQKMGAIAFDSCNHLFYFYDPKTLAWDTITGGSGGGSFDTTAVYNYINNIYNYFATDTAYLNQFMPAGVYMTSAQIIQDSIYRWCYRTLTVSDSCVDDTSHNSNITFLVNLFDSLATIRDSLQRDTTLIDAQTLSGTPIAYSTIDSNSTTHDTLHVRIPATGQTGKILSNDGTNLLWSNQIGAIQNGIVSGGRVTWLHDYVYNISPAVYYIDGVQYSSASTDITLAAADLNDDRIDIFNLTTSNTAVAVTGTAGSGIPPDYDASLQLNISFALVSANTTAPVGVVQQWIYKENVEWATAASAGTINPASTNNPYAGSLDVEGTNVTNAQYITFTAPTVPNMALYNALTFQIRSKGNFSTTKKLVFRWFVAPSNATGNNVPIGSGSYGFISTVTTYQTITIPLSDFGNITGANILRITQSNTSGNAGWYIDNIQLQKTGTTTGQIRVVDSIWRTPGKDSIQYTIGGVYHAIKDSTGGGGITQAQLDDSTAAIRAVIPLQFNPIAGTNVTLSGSYPNITFNSSGTSVTTADSTITATAAQTAFTFPSVPTSEDDYIIFRNGSAVDQSYYSASGNVVTFSTGRDAGDIIRFHRTK